MTKAIVTIVQERIEDDSPDASYLEQEGFEDRLQSYQEGNFHFIGVRAMALIKMPYGKDFIETRISSPGLWGIESDSGEEYFDSVFGEEKVTLLEMLGAMRNFEVIASY